MRKNYSLKRLVLIITGLIVLCFNNVYAILPKDNDIARGLDKKQKILDLLLQYFPIIVCLMIGALVIIFLYIKSKKKNNKNF